MRNLLTGMGLIVLLAFMVACGGGEVDLEEIYVFMQAEPTVHNDGSVSFDITTNLPDGAELMLTLQREGESSGPQGRVTIENGVATSPMFSDGGYPIAGNRALVVSLSIARLQDESVRAVIGEYGEALIGDLVQTSHSGNVVRATFDFNFN